jgi:threonine synthase
VTQEHDIYLANSLNSLRIEGQKTISVELAQQFDWEVPDVIIIPGGNLGNVSAFGRGFLMLKELGLIDRLPRLVCAQAERANPLYRSYLTGFKQYEPMAAQETLATAIQIGNPVSIDRAIKTLQLFDGIVEQASEDELANASARADLTGMYSCPHTGVALAVLFKLVERGQIAADHRVVVISTAHGLKFSDFKIAYHDRRLEAVHCRYANPPVLLPPSYGAVMDAIHAHLKALT